MPAMHLIIPYAAPSSQGFAAALANLKLPNLQKLLARLQPAPPDSGDAFSLSPPQERALAAAWGLSSADGQIPWAALQAHQVGHAANSAWAFITLCHWQVNTGHVAMSQLPLPALSEVQSAALLEAMQPYFEEDGITLMADESGRWLAQGEIFRDLATASPDRVVGRNLAAWMTTSPQAAPLRRLQNEMQMLLYTHPVNDARETLNLTPVNSFWLHGSGALPDGYQPPPVNVQPTVINMLKPLALTDNWPGWAQAWQALDTGDIASLLQTAATGQAVQLTLCGERSSQTWVTQPQPVWQKFKSLFGSQPLSELLEKL
ncbi:phosphoglycerate mutase [Rhodoferax sp. 4810]|nr:phosphoglycerate mutase [Rhodoferax jenense]